MYDTVIEMSNPSSKKIPPEAGLPPTPTDKKNIPLTAQLKEVIPAKTKTATLLNLGDLELKFVQSKDTRNLYTQHDFEPSCKHAHTNERPETCTWNMFAKKEDFQRWMTLGAIIHQNIDTTAYAENTLNFRKPGFYFAVIYTLMNDIQNAFYVTHYAVSVECRSLIEMVKKCMYEVFFADMKAEKVRSIYRSVIYNPALQYKEHLIQKNGDNSVHEGLSIYPDIKTIASYYMPTQVLKETTEMNGKLVLDVLLILEFFCGFCIMLYGRADDKKYIKDFTAVQGVMDSKKLRKPQKQGKVQPYFNVNLTQ